jgi:hypothetical protein
VYSWVWRALPGSRALKVVCALLLIIAVAALLWFVVFPWVDAVLPGNDVTVDPGVG